MDLVCIEKGRHVKLENGAVVAPFTAFKATSLWEKQNGGPKILAVSEYLHLLTAIPESSLRQMAKNAGLDHKGPQRDVKQRLIDQVVAVPADEKPKAPEEFQGEEAPEASGPSPLDDYADLSDDLLLDKYTKDQLQAHCDLVGVDHVHRDSKPDLIAKVREALQ